MQELTFDFKFKKADNKMFYYASVEVPKNIGRMEFEFDYFPVHIEGEKWINEVGVALTTPSGRDIGARVKPKTRMVVSGSYASSGFEKHEVVPGSWTFAITAGRFISPEFDVTLKVWLIEKKAGWFAGDTHCHTFLSDGKYSYDWIAKRSIKNGLDFMIMTDHNRTVMGELPSVEGLTMINGVEMTYPNGHANVWGVKEPYSQSFAVNEFSKWLERKEECERSGAIVSINHPKCKKCPWLWPLEDETFYDTIEVWNGPMRPDNQECIEWWHENLKKGRKLKIVGGSDYHSDFVVTNLLGNPTTWVYAKSSEPSDILEGIRNGNTTISEKVYGGTFIEMTSGDAIVGDTVKYSENAKVKVSVKNLKRGHTLYIKDGEGILYSHKAKKTGDFEVEVAVRGKGFVRAEVKETYKGLKKLLINVVLSFMIPQQAFKPHPDYCNALTSPIYFE